jgi:hypothetical protein
MIQHEEISKLNLKLEYAEQLRLVGGQTFSLEESKNRIKEILRSENPKEPRNCEALRSNPEINADGF